MKGIAIAMETIVYIILAVLVLAILLFFLTSQTRPIEDRVKLLQDSARYCASYIQVDSTCGNIGNVDNSNVAGGSKLVSDLITTCGKLGTLGCGTIGGDRQTCIQRCCTVCPVKP